MLVLKEWGGLLVNRKATVKGLLVYAHLDQRRLDSFGSTS